MKRYTFLIIGMIAVLLTACEVHETTETLKAGESRLVVYAFPSDSDEYLLNVSVTQPVSGYITEPQIQDVRCWTNDVEDEVTLLQVESHYSLPVYIYKVKGQHRPGDRIRIAVHDARLPDVTAETTIPRRTEMEVTEAHQTEVNARMVFRMNFTDPVETQDYYAVRVLERKIPNYHNPDEDEEHPEPDNNYYKDDNDSYWGGGYNWDEQLSYCTIFTEYEPLLSHYSDMNLDAWNEYYDYLYCFSDEAFQGPRVEMNLVALRNNTGRKDYTLEFYTLSPEYFRMLQSLNDQRSNEFGDSGFTQVTGTYNNVKGGYGCVAGYTCHSYIYKDGNSLDFNPILAR